METKMILHICTEGEWKEALEAGRYQAPSLESEGFIHCSRADQIAMVANNYYHGAADLVLLHIDTHKLAAELKWEAVGEDQIFPHIYGPVNIEAVIEVEELKPGEDGEFRY